MRGGFFGTDEDLILSWLLQCDGDETSIHGCQHFLTLGCSRRTVAGVICPPENTTNCASGDVRLVGRDRRYEGRVEVCLHDRWGRVCDDFWGSQDAVVVCNQLGFTSEGAAIATANAFNGAGEGFFILDDVNCEGNETELLNCQSRELSQHNCRNSEAAGVICPGESFAMEKIQEIAECLQN